MKPVDIKSEIITFLIKVVIVVMIIRLCYILTC
jgi:hypothetical protein